MENEERMESNVVEEKAIEVKQDNYQVIGFDQIGENSTTKTELITNITDQKKIFNLENKVDCMLNDCEGESIRVKEVLIKRYEKPLAEPVINEETGEIIKDKEYSMSCVLVDDNGKSYATGSKVFIIQLTRYLQLKGRMQDKSETFDIKIIKKKFGDKGNKALSFELI